MKIPYLLIILMALSGFSAAQKSISFASEYIDFKIDSQYFSINGVYTFRNNTNSDIEHKILFPFVCRTEFIDSLRVVNMLSPKFIDYKKDSASIIFPVQIASNKETHINVYYRQRTSKRNVYILTSAKTWGKPLEEAIYTLTAEKKLKILSYSFPQPDSVNEDSTKKIFYWKRLNFIPHNDFEITIDE